MAMRRYLFVLDMDLLALDAELDLHVREGHAATSWSARVGVDDIAYLIYCYNS